MTSYSTDEIYRQFKEYYSSLYNYAIKKRFIEGTLSDLEGIFENTDSKFFRNYLSTLKPRARDTLLHRIKSYNEEKKISLSMDETLIQLIETAHGMVRYIAKSRKDGVRGR